MVIQYSGIPPLFVLTLLVVFTTTGAAPLPPDASSTVTNVTCSTKFPVADIPDLKNSQKCLAGDSKNSKTVIDIDSVLVKIDDQSSKLELYLPGEGNGKTILINCKSDEMYPATHHHDNDDILELDCSPYAKMIVRGLVKSPAETANTKKRTTKECLERSNKVCSSKHHESWVNCPYTETEKRPLEVDFEGLGEECRMIGDKATGRWMYDACGNLDCLWCRPFSDYDVKTMTCKACTAGGLPFPSPPYGHSCQAASSDITTASASTSFVPTIGTQTSTTASTVIQTTMTATVKEDLSTPEMHGLPYNSTVKPDNSAPATDITTDNYNRSPEDTNILPFAEFWIYAGIRILVIALGVAAFQCYHCLRKDCHSMYKPGVRSGDDYSTVSTCPSADRSTSSEENVNAAL